MHPLYMNRKNRDEAFKVAGGRAAGLRKTSIRNQQLHPEYVADYPGAVETGFGNTQYKTFFAVLYSFEKML